MLGNGRSVGPGQSVRGPSGRFPQRSQPQNAHAQSHHSQSRHAQPRHAQPHYSQPRHAQHQRSLHQYTNSTTIPATSHVYAGYPNGYYWNETQQANNYVQPITYLQQENNNTQKLRTKLGDLSVNALNPTANVPNPFSDAPNPFTNAPNPTANVPNPFTDPPNPFTNAPNPTANFQSTNTNYNYYNRPNNASVSQKPRTKLSDLAKEYPHNYLQNRPTDNSPYLNHYPAACHQSQPKTHGSVYNNNVNRSYAPVYAPYNPDKVFTSNVLPAGTQRSLSALVNASIAEGNVNTTNVQPDFSKRSFSALLNASIARVNVYTKKETGKNYTSTHGAILPVPQKTFSNVPLNPRTSNHNYKREDYIPATRAVPVSTVNRHNTTTSVPVNSQATASSFNHKVWSRPVGASQKSLRAFLDQHNIQPRNNGIPVAHQQPKREFTAPNAHETTALSPQENTTPGNTEQKTFKAPYVPANTKIHDPSSLPPPKFIRAQQEANKLASALKTDKQEPPQCLPMESNPHMGTLPTSKSSPTQEQKDEKQEHKLEPGQTENDPSKSSYLTAPPRANVLPPPGYVHPLKKTEKLLRKQFYLNCISPSPELAQTSGNSSSDTIRAPVNNPAQKDDKKRYSPANQSPEVAPNEPEFMQFPDGKDLPTPKFFIELQRKEDEAMFRAASFMNSNPDPQSLPVSGFVQELQRTGDWWKGWPCNNEATPKASDLKNGDVTKEKPHCSETTRLAPKKITQKVPLSAWDQEIADNYAAVLKSVEAVMPEWLELISGFEISKAL